MHRILIPIVTLGLFCTLCAYAYGKVMALRHTPTQGEFVRTKLAEYRPVTLASSAPTPKGKVRYEYPFSCEDTDTGCLTLLMEAPKRPSPRSSKLADIDRELANWRHR